MGELLACRPGSGGPAPGVGGGEPRGNGGWRREAGGRHRAGGGMARRGRGPLRRLCGRGGQGPAARGPRGGPRERLGGPPPEDGLLDAVALSAVLSVQLDAPLVDLRSRPSDDEALVLVAEAAARRLKVLPLQVQDGRLVVAIAVPEAAATVGG